MYEDCTGGVSKTLLAPKSRAIVGTAAVPYGTCERDDERDDVPRTSETKHGSENPPNGGKSNTKGLGTRDNGVSKGAGLRNGDVHRKARRTSPYSCGYVTRATCLRLATT